MLVKILGIFDLIAALVVLAHTQFPKMTLISIGAYLIIKGLLFALSNDIASYIDVAVGSYIVLLAFNLPIFLLTIASSIYLAQKGLLSLI